MQQNLRLMNVKLFLPFDDYLLSTHLSGMEVRHRLEDNIEPRRRPSLFGGYGVRSKPYEGTLTGDTFEMSRIIGYRNSFLPLIKGEIFSVAGWTQVRIRMQPELSVRIFMVIWFAGVGLACVFILFSLVVSAGSQFSGGALIPFGMLLFGYALLTGAYRAESQTSKKFLAKLLEGVETE